MGAVASHEKITRVLNATAAGSSDITTATVVDMEGFQSCEFVVLLGALTASQETTVTVAQSDASGSGFADLTGAAAPTIEDDDDNQIVRVEVVKPRERYLKVTIGRATANAVVDGVIAIQRGADYTPVTDGTTVHSRTSVVSPAESA